MYHLNKPYRPTIGVLSGWQGVDGALDSFLSNVFRGIQAAAQQYGWNLMIACGILQRGMHTNEPRPAWPLIIPEADFVPVGPWNCDGILAVPPFHHEVGLKYMQALEEKGFPVAYTGDWEKGPGAIVDNLNGVKSAVFHLVEHGHHQIAFIAGRTSHLEGDSVTRLKGYQQGLVDAGIAYDPQMVEYGFHNTHGGYEACRRLLNKRKNFTAIVASNDQSAVGAITALREAGLQVPQDVAVIGFDDRLEGRANIPSLTTVHYPMYEMGFRTTEVLKAIMEHGRHEARVICVPTRLLVRESCGCIPGAQDEVTLRSNRNALHGIRWSDMREKEFGDPDLLHGGLKPRKIHPAVEPSRSPDAASSSIDWRSSPALARFNSPRFRRSEDIADESNVAIEKEITRTLFNDLHQMNRQEVELISSRIKQGFATSLEREDPAIFLYALNQILEFFVDKGEDPHACQNAISILRDRLSEIVAVLTENRTNLALEILDQARLLINDTARREMARTMVKSSRIAEIIGQMMTRFFASTSQAELLDVFNQYIPQFGIKHASVFIYEADGGDPVAWSRQAAGHNSRGAERRFVTRHFPPPGLYHDDTPINLVLLPLQTSNGPVGFVAYDGSNLEPCGVINTELMAALKGIQLYQAAVESRRLAEEANRLKSTFLSMVSHELRTPLNLISGLSNMLLREREGKEGEAARVNWDDLERIYISAQHLDGLIRDVIELSSLDIGNIHLVCVPMDVKEMLESVSIIGSQLALDKGLRWSMEIPSSLPWVLGDRTRLRQIILNLLTNAVKFTTKGYVLLAAFTEDHNVTIAVSDSGLGVPPEEQQIIFDEFRQSSRTTARGFGGFGLGLAICRRLVEMHGGKLAISSSGKEDEGSTFYFSLPAIERPMPLDAVSTSLDEAGRVLILAGENETETIIVEHLKNKGFEPVLCSSNSSEDWHQWIVKEKPDAIILSKQLTARHGWEILKYVKEKPATADVPVLFYTMDEFDCDCGALLEMNYMTKPVDAAVLTETLMSLDLQKRLDYEDDWLDGKLVLIVDDDPGILDLHTRIVTAQSHYNRVLQARNGVEALRLIREKKPDLVLLDLMMPEMNGFSVLEAMRVDEVGRNIPVVVVTGQTLHDEEMKRLNQGMAAVLSKGMYSRQETLEALSAAIARSRKPGTELQRLVLRAMAYIHTQYRENISRSDIAAHVGVSERHLARCFHSEIGLSPITYLNRFRVKVAKTLLDESRLSITEVAMEAGFSSGGYFTRVFRDETGISPRAYLKGKPDS